MPTAQQKKKDPYTTIILQCAVNTKQENRGCITTFANYFSVRFSYTVPTKIGTAIINKTSKFQRLFVWNSF